LESASLTANTERARVLKYFVLLIVSSDSCDDMLAVTEVKESKDRKKQGSYFLLLCSIHFPWFFQIKWIIFT